LRDLDTSDRKIPQPLRLFLTLLLIIAVVETCIMFFLPLVFPVSHGFWQNIVDAFLLTAFCAPFIWLLIARPLRRAALNEIGHTKAALEYIVEAVINFDEHGRIVSLNPAATRMFGYLPHEICNSGITRIIPDLLIDDRAARGQDETPASPQIPPETVGCRKDGSCFPVEISISAINLEGETSFTTIIHDISERKRVESLMTEQKAFMESLVQNSAVPTFVINAEHRVVIWNRACEELTGIKAQEMLGSDETWRAFYSCKRPTLADVVIDNTIELPAQYYSIFGNSELIPEGLQAEGWFRNLNGRDRYIFFNAAPIRNGNAELLAVIETIEDISERKRYEEQLEYQSNYDTLTNLPNRNLLSDRIHQVLLLARRSQRQAAIFYIDLDRFKVINDNLGYDVGDTLLQTVADRLTNSVRAGDTVARQGGDEFVVVISDLVEADAALQIATTIREAIARPVNINEHELVVTCSIGISLFPRDGEDVQTLVKHADVAMSRAKEQGSNMAQFYTNGINARSLARMTMEKHLWRALERDELLLNYQPKVCLRTGRIAGMEALIRWRNPEMGLVSPASFIPLAEETGIIESIGEWVIRTACAQNKAWQDAGFPPVAVAVNLSARQLRQANIAGIVRKILHETGLAPRYLEIELTESMVMQHVDRATEILNELKRMGTRLSLDDFGTGYSSLSYLKRFPFDTLKVDQSFVRDITSDPDSAAIAKTVIAMAHSLHMKVIAEGVETEGQLNYLRAHACDEIQGYYFSRPVPAAEFGQLLRDRRHLHLPADADRNSQKTLLVVDDEEHILSSLQRMLGLEGYHVLAARSAAEGFELLANNDVAVVLSDLQMPGINGNEFLGRVRELYPETVRILISGQADLTSVADAIDHGTIYKFFSKPWDDDYVREKIDEAFKYRRSFRGRDPGEAGTGTGGSHPAYL